MSFERKLPNRRTVLEFTEAKCLALAYEIHLLTGWRTAMLHDGGMTLIEAHQLGHNDSYLEAHLFCLNPRGRAVDITGSTKLGEFKQRWSWLPDYHVFRDFSEFCQEMDLWKQNYKNYSRAKIWAKQVLININYKGF